MTAEQETLNKAKAEVEKADKTRDAAEAHKVAEFAAAAGNDQAAYVDEQAQLAHGRVPADRRAPRRRRRPEAGGESSPLRLARGGRGHGAHRGTLDPQGDSCREHARRA
jgi:hypothetical protein